MVDVIVYYTQLLTVIEKRTVDIRIYCMYLANRTDNLYTVEHQLQRIQRSEPSRPYFSQKCIRRSQRYLRYNFVFSLRR
jgi:hypothetical protein